MYYTLKTLLNAAEVELNAYKTLGFSINTSSFKITNDFSIISQIRGTDMEPQARRIVNLAKELLNKNIKETRCQKVTLH